MRRARLALLARALRRDPPRSPRLPGPRALERLFGPGAGGWAALLLASVPALALVAGVAWNDWFVLLYLACALEHHLDARREAPAARLERHARPVYHRGGVWVFALAPTSSR